MSLEIPLLPDNTPTELRAMLDDYFARLRSFLLLLDDASTTSLNNVIIRFGSIAALEAETWASTEIPETVILTTNFLTGDGGGIFVKASSGTADGWMLVQDATGQRWSRQWFGIVDGRWAGMNPDGVTDNTVAFDRILNWARAVGAEFRALTAWFPKGDYALDADGGGIVYDLPDDTTPMISNLHLMGEGAWHTDDGTIFRLAGTANPTSRLLTVLSGVYLDFSNLRFHTAIPNVPRLIQVDSMGDSADFYSSFTITFTKCRFTCQNGVTNDLMQLSNCSGISFIGCDWSPTGSTVALRLGTKFDSVDISNITKANPGVVTTSTSHGFRVGDDLIVQDIVGMTELNGNVYFVSTVPSPTSLTLCNATTGVPLDTSMFGVYSSGGTLQISRNVSSFGGGTASQIEFLSNCLFRGHIERSQYDNVTFNNTAYSVTVDAEIPVRYINKDTEDFENTTLINGFAGFGSGADGDFYVQGALEAGLTVDGGVYGRDYPVIFKVTKGGHFWSTHFRSTILSTQTAIEIGASAGEVTIDPSVYNDGIGQFVVDLRPSQPTTFPDSVVCNGSFEVWDDTTSVSPTTQQFIATKWKVRRGGFNSGGTWSQQPGFFGAEWCLRIQRNLGDLLGAAMYTGYQIPTSKMRALAGRKVRIVCAARKGALYSHSGSLLPATIYTGTGVDESPSLGSGFPTGNVTKTFVGETLATTENWLIYDEYQLPTNATEGLILFQWQPTGVAGASDYAEITHVELVPSETIAMWNRRKKIPLSETLAELRTYYEKVSVRAVNGTLWVPCTKKRSTPVVSQTGGTSVANATVDGCQLTHTGDAAAVVTFDSRL